MTDTEILDWINDHAIELGLMPDWQGRDPETGKLMFQKTDIRRRVLKLAEREAPNIPVSQPGATRQRKENNEQHR